MQPAHEDYAQSAIAGTVEAGYLSVNRKTRTAMTACHAIQRTIKMAAIDTTRSVHFQTASAGLTLSRFIASFTAWKDARATRKALSVLSDRELDDIGLTRSDIANFSVRS